MSSQNESKNKWLRFGLIILASLAVIVWLVVWQSFDKNLHLYFLNVGQGDSIYVRLGNKFDLLVDGGPDNSVLSQLGKAMPFYDREINLIILSHPHADHVTGLIDVLNNYKVDEIWLTDATTTTPEYIEFLNIIKEKNIKTIAVKAGYEKDVIGYNNQNLQIKVLWPQESYIQKTIDNLNNTSIVECVKYGDFSALLTGDVEQETLSLLTTYSLPLTTVFKVPHHGSSNGAYEPFIQKILPKVAIIEVGDKNKFGHPAESILKLYQKHNIPIYRTDQNGLVEVISGGIGYKIRSEK